MRKKRKVPVVRAWRFLSAFGRVGSCKLSWRCMTQSSRR